MAGRRDEPGEIVRKPRQVEVLQGRGMAIADAVRQIGVTEPTYYRWRKRYGGLNRDRLERLKRLETESQRLRRAVSDLTLDKMIVTEAARGNRRSARRNFRALRAAARASSMCGRRAADRSAALGRASGQPRSTQREVPCGAPDGERLTEDIIELTRARGRYGHRMITGLPNTAGWHVNHTRVERIWRREGPKIPHKQARKGRLWPNDGSCIRLRPERPDQVWSHGFVRDRPDDGRLFRTLDIIDGFPKKALVIGNLPPRTACHHRGSGC